MKQTPFQNNRYALTIEVEQIPVVSRTPGVIPVTQGHLLSKVSTPDISIPEVIGAALAHKAHQVTARAAADTARELLTLRSEDGMYGTIDQLVAI